MLGSRCPCERAHDLRRPHGRLAAHLRTGFARVVRRRTHALPDCNVGRQHQEEWHKQVQYWRGCWDAAVQHCNVIQKYSTTVSLLLSRSQRMVLYLPSLAEYFLESITLRSECPVGGGVHCVVGRQEVIRRLPRQLSRQETRCES